MPKMVSGYSENALNHKSGSPRKDRSDRSYEFVSELHHILVTHSVAGWSWCKSDEVRTYCNQVYLPYVELLQRRRRAIMLPSPPQLIVEWQIGEASLNDS